MRTTYKFRGGRLLDRDGFPLLNQAERARELQAPMLMRDFDSTGREYRSPIDGKMITSRSERREDLIRNGCVEVDPPKAVGRDKDDPGFKNPRFAKKRRLPLKESVAASLDKDHPHAPRR
jgi:hypothetical protein